MGNIANTYSFHGLASSGTPTSTEVSGTVSLGQSQAKVVLQGADIFYIFKVTSTGASDVATLTLSSGSVAQTTGTPTIADGDGEDFEGVTLGTMATLQGIHIAAGSVASGTIQVADSGNLIDVTADSDASIFTAQAPNGHAITSQTLVITFSAAAQDVTVIVAGKTT